MFFISCHINNYGIKIAYKFKNVLKNKFLNFFEYIVNLSFDLIR
jgi:hypothetical protein